MIIPSDDWNRHLYIVGKSGTGKSILLYQLVRDSIAAGEGIAFYDPHGDESDRILDDTPRSRADDIVIIDPTDCEHRIAINPFFGRKTEEERALATANIVSTFRHVWHDAWSTTRMQYVMTNLVAALLEAPPYLSPTMLSIPRMIEDEYYRDAVAHHVTNPPVRAFFDVILQQWGKRAVSEAFAPIENRIGQLNINPTLRHLLGQYRPSIRFDDVLAKDRIVIARIPKGIFGEEPTALLGSFIFSGFLMAGMGRATLPESERRPYRLIFDEFQTISSGALPSFYSESRKYGLSLTAAHQYIGQLSEDLRKAIFGNVANIVSFRLDAEDAEHLARELDPYGIEELTQLEVGQICARLMVNMEPDIARIGRVAPPEPPRHGRREQMIKQSRHRYGVRRDLVERRIGQWQRRTLWHRLTQ